jgi:GNAT superfamily N-acetyltransferase
MNDDLNVVISPLEEARFGCRTARANGITSQNLPIVLEFCRNNRIQFLIARCHVSDIQAAQDMEQEGFFITDTLVYYTRDLTKQPIPAENGVAHVRPMKAGEEAKMMEVALESFRNYKGHYHADQRLDRKKCDATYADWARQKYDARAEDDDFWVAELKGRIVGFGALTMNNPDEGELVLAGVHPDFRGLGYYQSLVLKAMEWSLSKGAKRMLISTQLNNFAVQKVWVRLGFEMDRGYYTLHRWFGT